MSCYRAGNHGVCNLESIEANFTIPWCAIEDKIPTRKSTFTIEDSQEIRCMVKICLIRIDYFLKAHANHDLH